MAIPVSNVDVKDLTACPCGQPDRITLKAYWISPEGVDGPYVYGYVCVEEEEAKAGDE